MCQGIELFLHLVSVCIKTQLRNNLIMKSKLFGRLEKED